MTPTLSSPSRQEDGADRDRSPAEWVTLVVSLVILVGTFAMIAYLYVAEDQGPIDLRTEAHLEDVRENEEAFYLPVTVRNAGNLTAQNVQIEATLEFDGEMETSDFSILSLPGRGSETGIVAFAHDPRDGELTVRITSYLE